jgi:hypothetical protein
MAEHAEHDAPCPTGGGGAPVNADLPSITRNAMILELQRELPNQRI